MRRMLLLALVFCLATAVAGCPVFTRGGQGSAEGSGEADTERG